MGLISSAKALWKKVKQKSQSSAQKAYTKKVQTERTQQRKHIVTSNYDKVRSRTTRTTTTSRSSGGSSSYSRPSGTTSWSSRTTSSSSSTSPKSRQRKTSSSNTSGWSSYAQNTFKSSNKASQGKASGTSVPRTASGAIDWGKINSKGYKGTASKALKEAYEHGKGINALGTKVETRKGGGVKSKDPTMEDFLKLQNASRNGNLKLDKKTAKKMGSRTAYAANRNSMARASHGFMQGMAFGDVESGPVKYNKAARKALKESRESTAGMVGYGVGQMAGFATGGTSGAAKSLASGGIKAGAKAAAKSGAKTTAKKFVRNRVTEMAVEAPLNAADAMKMSKDENGKVDVKKAAGLMALNTGLTGGTGALMEGAAIKFTKKNANRLIHLQSKANKNTITKKEGRELKALYDKLDNVRKDTARADSNIADEGFRKGKNTEMDAIVERYRPDAEKRMQKAKDIKTYRDIRQNERIRTQRKAEAAAEQFASTPEGQRAINDARVKEFDDRINELRATEGTKKQKLKAKKEADRLERERNKLEQSVKADVSGKRYYATREEVNAASEAIRENERKLANLERRQSFSTDTNSPGYKKRQKQIDNLKASIDADKEAVSRYTIGNTKGASKPVTAPKQTADVAPKADDATVRSKDAMLPDAPKAETEVPGKKGASKPQAENVETPTVQTPEATDVHKATTEKVSKIGAYSNTDKAFKMSADNVLRNAPDRADEVGRLADEYQKASKGIAANKAKIKRSNTPEHIAQYEKEIKALEETQNKIHGQMRNIEDTHVSRYDSGKSVLEEIDPTDGKAATKRKTGKVREKIQSIRRATESSLIEFERAAKASGDKELLNAVNNVYLARNKAGAFIESARTSFNTRTTTGKSLNDIFKDAGAFNSKEARNDFNMYALLRHHIDRADKGKPVFMKDGHPLSIPDALQAMGELESRYGADKLAKFSDELTEYSNDLLKYRYDAGLISKETYENTLKEYPHYVPTYRIKDGAEGFVFEEANNVSLDSVIKAAKGGESPIEDLYSQLHKITNDVITNAEQNEMVKLYAKDMGFDPKQLSKDVNLEDLEKSRIKAGKNGTISYFVDGQRVDIKANDQAVKGLREWNGDDHALYCNACAKFGKMTGVRAFKGLITDWNLAFGIRNGMRDMQQALVNSKDTRWFVKSMPSSMQAIANKNNAYRKLYEANGGKYFVPSGNPRTVKDPTQTSLFEKVMTPIETINGAIEMNPRMSEFIGTINKEADGILKKQGKTLEDLKDQAKRIIEKDKSIADADKVGAIEDKYAEMVCALVGKETVDRAMRNSADITLNFSRHGYFVKALNSGPVPYLNPSIQGLSKTIRLFTEGKADKALFNLGAKLGVMTLAPAAVNEILLADNRDYQDLNSRDKDTNFFIPLGDGKFMKIPKPRENAALSEPAIYGMRYLLEKAQIGSIKPGEYSSADNWKQMFVSIKDNIGPVNPLTSNYFSPLLNTARNKTWYGGNIESMSDQELPVSDRRDETTSALSIMLTDSKAMKMFLDTNFMQENPVGKFVASNLSPKKIDNLMDSYLGMIYDMGIKPTAANRNLGSTKANIANYFTNQFILDGVYSNKLAQGYYDKLDKLNKGSKDGEYTYKAKKFQQKYGYDAMTYSSARAAVFDGDDKDFAKMTPQEKQEYARNLKKYQNDVYRDGIHDEKGTFGSFEDNFKRDPLRVMARELRKTSFEDKTGKMAEEKVLQDFTYTNKDGKNQFADALKEFKKSDVFKEEGKKKGIKTFFNDAIRLRGLLGESGGSKSYPSYTAVSLVAAERNIKSGSIKHAAFADAFGVNQDTQKEAYDYLGVGYTLKNYAHTHKSLENMAMRENKYLNEMDDNKKSIKLASKKYSDGSFYIEGKYVDYKCNPARCIVSDGMTSKEYNKWMDKYDLHSFQKGHGKEDNYGKSSEREVINAIEKDYGDRSNEFKAAMYRMFYDWGDNPYGEIGDYSQKNDRGLHHAQSGYGGYGYGRRGYGGYGGGWGGGYGGYGGGKDWNTYVGEIFDMSEKKLHDYTKPSELTEAYRRRARKKQMVNQKRKG